MGFKDSFACVNRYHRFWESLIMILNGLAREKKLFLGISEPCKLVRDDNEARRNSVQKTACNTRYKDSAVCVVSERLVCLEKEFINHLCKERGNSTN